MKVDTKAISYILRTAVKNFGVRLGTDYHDVHAEGAVRNESGPGWQYLLRPPAWCHRVDIDERSLLLAPSPEATLALIEDSVAIGASALRGVIFRDLLMNDIKRPVDYIGDGNADEVRQRIEALGVLLIERAERIR